MDKAVKKGATHLKGNLGNAKSPSAKFYKKVPWHTWWNEFITSREKNGRMTYVTSWSFAKAKGKNHQESNWIYRCIGPKPAKLPFNQNRKSQLPHLGDWQQQRAKAYFYDNDSVDKMRAVIAKEMNGIEAGRGSATVILDLIAKWMKYDDKLDEAFGGSPLVESKNGYINEKRSDLFFKYKSKTKNAIMELVRQYLECHGIGHEGLNDLGQLVMAVSQSAARASLQGAATGAVIGQSPALGLLAKAIEDKSRTFNIPLPSILVGNGHDEEQEK
jgi:hypothetical protein